MRLSQDLRDLGKGRISCGGVNPRDGLLTIQIKDRVSRQLVQPLSQGLSPFGDRQGQILAGLRCRFLHCRLEIFLVIIVSLGAEDLRVAIQHLLDPFRLRQKILCLILQGGQIRYGQGVDFVIQLVDVLISQFLTGIGLSRFRHRMLHGVLIFFSQKAQLVRQLRSRQIRKSLCVLYGVLYGRKIRRSDLVGPLIEDLPVLLGIRLRLRVGDHL